MGNIYFKAFLVAVFTAVSVAAVFADIENGGNSSAVAGSETSDLLNAFSLASAASQETSTGCTMNPMSNNQQVVTELPPLPENAIQPVSFSPSYSASNSPPPSDEPREPRYYPPRRDAPPPSPTPEPGTWLIMGIGAIAMVPLLRRKRSFRNNNCEDEEQLD